MENTEKRFEGWTEVDCLDCTHYWNALCDGTSKGSSKPCTAFIATRSTDIPEQIKSLRSTLKWLKISNILLGIAIIIHGLDHLIGG